MSSSFLLYGSNGYTGSLIARRAVEYGLRPILAGRNAASIEAQAAGLGLEHRAFELADTAALDAALADAPVVLHCAGPFTHTFRAMADGCLRTGTHYLDITGEIPVFEALASRDAEARARGIMLLPGIGIDVVPTDCLAAHLKRRLPSANRLTLAFHSVGGATLSRGTATTSVEGLPRGGVIRRDGKLTPVPHAAKTRKIDFGKGPVETLRIPWGDAFTAFYSTGIPNIEDFAVVPGPTRMLMVTARYLRPLMGLRLVQGLLKRGIQNGPPGATDEERARVHTIVWGEVEDDQGRKAVSRLHGPHAYTWTALTALAAVRKVLAGVAPAGYQTPATAYGADFVLEGEGVTREDVAGDPAHTPSQSAC